jgi:hypothetical protein
MQLDKDYSMPSFTHPNGNNDWTAIKTWLIGCYNNGGFRSKKLFTFVINQRNLAYGSLPPPQLLDATTSFQHNDMIYALIPSCHGNRDQIYIGETSDGVFKRFQHHISDAANHVPNHFQNNSRNYAHHRYLHDHQFLPSSLLVIPLQLLPSAAQLSSLSANSTPTQINDAKAKAKSMRCYMESRFTCYFDSHVPFGWNARSCSRLQPINRDFEHLLPVMLRGMNPNPKVDSFKVASNISYYLKNPTLLPAIGVLTHFIERQHAQPNIVTLRSTNRSLLYQVMQILASTSSKHLARDCSQSSAPPDTHHQ